MQPQTEGLNFRRVFSLPPKTAKHHRAGEQVSQKEEGPKPFFYQQPVTVIAKWFPWQLTCSPFCDINFNTEELSPTPAPRTPTLLPESPISA